mmetsp:Transcript_8976/g.27935  ORF Transcript_8976/g.27935 Transcript_8976/m.27935 type:complete len:228 (+) Transcript_8976:391-1074(+)
MHLAQCLEHVLVEREVKVCKVGVWLSLDLRLDGLIQRPDQRQRPLTGIDDLPCVSVAGEHDYLDVGVLGVDLADEALEVRSRDVRALEGVDVRVLVAHFARPGLPCGLRVVDPVGEHYEVGVTHAHRQGRGVQRGVLALPLGVAGPSVRATHRVAGDLAVALGVAVGLRVVGKAPARPADHAHPRRAQGAPGGGVRADLRLGRLSEGAWDAKWLHVDIVAELPEHDV